MHAALADFAAVLAPRGVLVIQNRNYDRILAERTRFMPVSSRTEGEDETLFLRISDFPPGDEDVLDFTVVTLKKRKGAWSQSSRTTPLRALRRETLEKALRGAGFAAIRAYGGYDSSAFDESSSADLILVARR